MGWATFWAIFSQTRLVTLVTRIHCQSAIQAEQKNLLGLKDRFFFHTKRRETPHTSLSATINVLMTDQSVFF
jgi:hypothetical protein